MLKGVWFCEGAQFSREASLNYSKLDPKRFVLTSDGNGIILYFQAPRQSTGDGGNNPKIRFPSTTWSFRAWSPGGKGPIEAGKAPESGKAGTECLNFENKGGLLHLVVADSIEGLGRDGKYDNFVFKRMAEDWYADDWQGDSLAKKLEIHAQTKAPMSSPDMSQSKPNDGNKAPGKGKDISSGKEPEKAAEGKEKDKDK